MFYLTALLIQAVKILTEVSVGLDMKKVFFFSSSNFMAALKNDVFKRC